MNNKSLLVILSVSAIILIVLVVVLIIVLMPLIMNMIGVVQQNGLKGIVESIGPVLERIWSGSGK